MAPRKKAITKNSLITQENLLEDLPLDCFIQKFVDTKYVREQDTEYEEALLLDYECFVKTIVDWKDNRSLWPTYTRTIDTYYSMHDPSMHDPATIAKIELDNSGYLHVIFNLSSRAYTHLPQGAELISAVSTPEPSYEEDVIYFQHTLEIRSTPTCAQVLEQCTALKTLETKRAKEKQKLMQQQEVQKIEEQERKLLATLKQKYESTQ